MEVDIGLAVVGLYGIMRVLETTFVGLMDEKPPHWIVEGKDVPLPTTLFGRLAYAVDLTTSLRGNSWFSKTHWEWAPKALVNSPMRLMSRTRYLRFAIYLIAFPIPHPRRCGHGSMKSRTWARSNPYPITSLPWHEQLVYATSVCAQTALSITFPYTIVSSIFVLLRFPS